MSVTKWNCHIRTLAFAQYPRQHPTAWRLKEFVHTARIDVSRTPVYWPVTNTCTNNNNWSALEWGTKTLYTNFNRTTPFESTGNNGPFCVLIFTTATTSQLTSSTRVNCVLLGTNYFKRWFNNTFLKISLVSHAPSSQSLAAVWIRQEGIYIDEVDHVDWSNREWCVEMQCYQD